MPQGPVLANTVIAWRVALATAIRVASFIILIFIIAHYADVLTTSIERATSFTMSSSSKVLWLLEQFKFRGSWAHTLFFTLSALGLIMPNRLARWIITFPPSNQCPRCRYHIQEANQPACPECGLRLLEHRSSTLGP